MDLKLVHEAVEAYANDAEAADRARLEFFEGLFAIQQEQADLVAAECGYEAPAAEDAGAWYWEGEAALAHAPISIDAASFSGFAAKVAAYMAEHAGFAEQAAAALAAYDWEAFCQKADLSLAGRDPMAFLEDFLVRIDEFDVPAELPANVAALVVRAALRPYLQVAQEAVMAALGDEVSRRAGDAPVACPVCGTPAGASIVHDGGAQGASGREQFCSSCGCQWPYERIRCGVCGQKNQGHLHYFHIEGDSAHRLQKCDDCGQYERVVFQSDIKTAPCMDVEDVVMARLDHVALDPRFRVEKEA